MISDILNSQDSARTPRGYIPPAVYHLKVTQVDPPKTSAKGNRGSTVRATIVEPAVVIDPLTGKQVTVAGQEITMWAGLSVEQDYFFPAVVKAMDRIGAADKLYAAEKEAVAAGRQVNENADFLLGVRFTAPLSSKAVAQRQPLTAEDQLNGKTEGDILTYPDGEPVISHYEADRVNWEKIRPSSSTAEVPY